MEMMQQTAATAKAAALLRNQELARQDTSLHAEEKEVSEPQGNTFFPDGNHTQTRKFPPIQKKKNVRNVHEIRYVPASGKPTLLYEPLINDTMALQYPEYCKLALAATDPPHVQRRKNSAQQEFRLELRNLSKTQTSVKDYKTASLDEKTFINRWKKANSNLELMPEVHVPNCSNLLINTTLDPSIALHTFLFDPKYVC